MVLIGVLQEFGSAAFARSCRWNAYLALRFTVGQPLLICHVFVDGAWRLALSEYLHEILCVTESIVHAKLSESPHLQSVGLFLAQHLEAILLFFRC